MKSSLIVFSCLFVCLLITAVLFLLFGETTVRRLRKNPETKELLGFEYVSGRDIMNVAMALSLPRKLMHKAANSKLKFMFADADKLYGYVSRYDLVLARMFYYLFVVDAVMIFVLIAINLLGIS